jgi:hypothetical protein
MSDQHTSKRIRERLALRLPVRVECRESLDFDWLEVTRLQTVTPFGAGFKLKHPTEKGRILHMTIPMPRQLRVFDHAEDQYRVFALVRHVQLLIESETQSATFDVGVAFIGKRPPASYLTEPWKRYEIANSTVQPIQNPETIQPLSVDQRTLTRHNIAVDIQLETIEEQGNANQTEMTVTENISTKGATMYTTLEIPVGRFVRLRSSQYSLTIFAVIRSRNIGPDGIARIHVEFIDREWPL